MEKDNPFKKVGVPDQEVPKDLKKKVMDDINSIQLLLEVTSLFSSNYAETLESFFKTKKPNNNNPNTD